jgi:hypothetical protein
MTLQDHRTPDQEGGYVVRRPRVTDAIGEALRTTFCVPCLPADMQAALRRLDTARPN